MNNKVSIFANDVQAPIKVELHENGEYFVSARELHQFLGSQAKFTDWCERMFDYGFEENKDYFVFYFDVHKNVNVKIIDAQQLSMNQRSRRGIQTEYWLTFRCAQHIGMLQKSKEGAIIRDYFISCEERLKQIQALIVETQTSAITNLEAKFDSFVDEVKYSFQSNFQKVKEYFEYVEGRIDDLEAKLTTQNKNTAERVDKIEEKLDFKAVACIYVLFCPRRKWYKIGSSYDAKTRKKTFTVIEANLKIVIEIPCASRDEAYAHENALHKRFADKHREGEWYALDENDLAYLRNLAQNNTTHLMQQMA